MRHVWLDGRDVLPGLMESHPDDLARSSGVPFWVLKELGAVPSYYLRYYYAHDEVLAEQLESPPRAEVVARIERELLDQYRDPALTEKPALLEQRGGAFYSEAATDLVTSLRSGAGDVQVVDVRNEGALAGLAVDDVVELPARILRGGPVPLSQAPLAPELLGLVQHVAAYERLAVRAALTGDRVVARKALLTHPLIGQHAYAAELLDRLLEADADHLRQFERERVA